MENFAFCAVTPATEQYLNKKWTCVREKVHASFDIIWLSFRFR